MRRTIKGIGSAYYTALEDAFARNLLDTDEPTRHDEVALFHALKVELDAAPADPDSPEWEPERQRLARELGEQTRLAA